MLGTWPLTHALGSQNEQGELIVERRRVDRNFPSWGIELCSFLDGIHVPAFPEITVATKYATEHRCGIVFKGRGLCDKMTGTDPLKDQCVQLHFLSI